MRDTFNRNVAVKFVYNPPWYFDPNEPDDHSGLFFQKYSQYAPKLSWTGLGYTTIVMNPGETKVEYLTEDDFARLERAFGNKEVPVGLRYERLDKE